MVSSLCITSSGKNRLTKYPQGFTIHWQWSRLECSRVSICQALPNVDPSLRGLGRPQNVCSLSYFDSSALYTRSVKEINGSLVMGAKSASRESELTLSSIAAGGWEDAIRLIPFCHQLAFSHFLSQERGMRRFIGCLHSHTLLRPWCAVLLSVRSSRGALRVTQADVRKADMGRVSDLSDCHCPLSKSLIELRMSRL